MKPTDEQVQEFWEKLGFRYIGYWEYPDGSYNYILPPRDLNNLKKWGIDKLVNEGWTIMMETVMINGTVYYEWCLIRAPNEGLNSASDEDCDTALFWSLWKALGLEKL